MQVERKLLQASWLQSSIRVGEAEKEEHYGMQNTLIHSMYSQHTHMTPCTHISHTHIMHVHIRQVCDSFIAQA